MGDLSRSSLFLEQKRVEAILNNKNTTNQWEEKKKAHEEVQKSLEHYAGKMQEFIMVPIGKRGLMRGRIVNTNQVFVSLGAGWFTKICSVEAQKICSRRISDCNQMLDKLEKERKLLEGWTALSAKQVFATEDSKEIIEPYNEQEEVAWREQHTDKVKKHKQKLAEVRQKLDESRGKEKNTDDELWKHLELLELQEEFEDELDRLGENSDSENESVSPLDSDDDSYSEEDEEESKSNEHLLIDNKVKNSSAMLHNNTQIADQSSSDHPKTIIGKQITSSLSKRNTTKVKQKKVTFATTDNCSGNDRINEDEKSGSVRQRENITLGQVIEHAVDPTTYQQVSQESRPVSKFKSSKLARKK